MFMYLRSVESISLKESGDEGVSGEEVPVEDEVVETVITVLCVSLAVVLLFEFVISFKN